MADSIPPNDFIDRICCMDQLEYGSCEFPKKEPSKYAILLKNKKRDIF